MEIEAIRLANLKALLADKGWTREELAERLGHRDAGTVGHWFMDPTREGYRRITSPSARGIERIAEKDRGWLDQRHDIAILDQVLGPHMRPTPGEIVVSLLDVKASMGLGQPQPGHDAIVGKISVSEEWVRRNLPSVTSPKNLRVITGYGDSMKGTFEDGDPLFVDTGVREVRIDAVYVFALEGELYIKTIQRLPGDGYKIISDNKKYDPYVIDAASRKTMEIMGRVVWAWNGRRL